MLTFGGSLLGARRFKACWFKISLANVKLTGLASSYRTRKRQVTVYKWNRKAACSLKIP